MSRYKFNLANYIKKYENISREEFFRRINFVIDSLKKYSGVVDNIKLAIFCFNKMLISYRTGKKLDLTKEQLHITINVLEKIYVDESLSEEEKSHHHYMAQLCRDMLDSFK